MVEATQWVEYQTHENAMWADPAYSSHVQIIDAPAVQCRKRTHEIDESDHKMTGHDRNNRRKMATQREKRRMEKLNTCIEDIRSMVCPDMKTPTKAKILREAINRIQYLEKMTAQLLQKRETEPTKSELFDQTINPPPMTCIPVEPVVDQPVIFSSEIPPCYSPGVTHGFITPDTSLSGFSSPHENPHAFIQENPQSYSPENLSEMLQMSDDSNQEEFYLQTDHLFVDSYHHFDDATISYKYE